MNDHFSHPYKRGYIPCDLGLCFGEVVSRSYSRTCITYVQTTTANKQTNECQSDPPPSLQYINITRCHHKFVSVSLYSPYVNMPIYVTEKGWLNLKHPDVGMTHARNWQCVSTYTKRQWCR